MAKASINTGDTAQAVHTRTTGDATESQVAVLGIDGSDSVVPADATHGLKTDQRPSTSGGLSIMRSLDIDETEEDVKTSAGQVYGYTFANQATAWRWLKFYNATAANVTVGTTTPVITVGLPPSSAGHVPWPQGLAFGTAISVAATTGIADSDTGAPAANDVSVHVFYA